MQGWQQDKAWSDKFLDDIRSALGVHLFQEPPVKEDQQHNTDLIIFRSNDLRVGCRIRKHHYLKFSDEITIRAGRPSGMKTEMTKIIEGWGDYFFYGFANKEETGLDKWIIGDLKAFRIWLFRTLYKNAGKIPAKKQNNTDGSSFFLAFKYEDIPNFVIARKS